MKLVRQVRDSDAWRDEEEDLNLDEDGVNALREALEEHAVVAGSRR